MHIYLSHYVKKGQTQSVNLMNVQQILMFIVLLLAGTGVFLVGVNLLTSNIEQLATSKIKVLFGKTANKKIVNVGIGAATTALIQSSGVTTVLIVGFVNVGIMNLYQATAMIMGANIGTTITAQIASLSAFPITTYVQALVFIGVMMSMICKKENFKKTGLILAGLGLVFIGLAIMSDSMSANRSAIQGVFEVVKNPFLLFFIGIIATALVQSSSATTSVIIAMSVAGLTIGTGGNEVLFIILGTNIGSCVTALMSSFGAGTNAKRASIIHLMFNTFGAVIFFIMLMIFPSFMEVTFRRWFSSAATQIAMFHTFFNVTCTLIFLPFTSGFVKLSSLIIKDKAPEPAEATYLDNRIISSPRLAIEQLKRESMLLADKAMDAFSMSYDAFAKRDTSILPKVQDKIENAINHNQRIIDYIIKVSVNCTQSQERYISNLHSNLGDIMRIAEIADNFIKYTKKETEKNLEFSQDTKDQLDIMVGCVKSLYEKTRSVILDNRLDLMSEIDSTEDKIDRMRKDLINSHITRLNNGTCKPENSSIFINLVSNLERLGDHLTYIAYTAKQ